MTPDRCPSCGAAVPGGAPWCTLCFADLRPRPVEPEPVAEVVPQQQVALGAVREPAYAASVTPDPLTTPLAAVAPEAAAETAGQDTVGPTWPCTSCGDAVAIALDTCPGCGTGFLAGLSGGLEITLPGVSDPRSLSNGAKWAIAGVGALAVTMVLLVLAVIVGAFL